MSSELENLLSSLIEAVPDSIQMKDADGRWVLANGVCLRAFGLENREWRGLTDLEIGTRYPELAQAMNDCKTSDDAAWQRGGQFRTEEAISQPDGSKAHVDIVKVPMLDEKGGRKGLVIIGRDVTARQRLQQHLAIAIEVGQSIFWELDFRTGQILVDLESFRVLGLGVGPKLTTLDGWRDRMHRDDLEEFQSRLRQSTESSDAIFKLDYRMANESGVYQWIRTSGRVVDRSVEGVALLAVGTSLNISERKRAEQELQINEERSRNMASMLRLMCDNVPDMIWAKDMEMRYIFANKAICKNLLGACDTDEPIGKTDVFFAERAKGQHPNNAEWHSFGELCQDSDNETLERMVPSVFEESGNAMGRYMVLDVHKAPFHDDKGKLIGIVGSGRDITDRKQAAKQLEYIAHYDALTGLPNRLLMADRMRQAIAQVQRRKEILAIAYLDLDGFKLVNDHYGHDVGDRLLAILANRMKETLREGDTLARLGGDEFVAVLLDLHERTAAYPMLTRLLEAVSQPVALGDLVLQVSASLGVTFYPQSEDIDADHLLRQADQAMYQAKLTGKNRYHVFDLVRDHSVRGMHETLEYISTALQEHQFSLHYQPKINLRTGVIVGFEALIRWRHPIRGVLLPASFLPVIEDHPMAVELGEWVMESALAKLQQWNADGLDFNVSVNVGAFHLQRPDFVDRLRIILGAYPNARPANFVLEVTETSAIEDVAHVSKVIDECGELGVVFALDDFGTGYSSLTYLRRLPVAIIKIDQTFVRDMLQDPEDMAIVEGILSFANAFGRVVIAEGVESDEQSASLLKLGCEIAQGFGIAHPMVAEEVPRWVADWQVSAKRKSLSL